MGNQNKTAAGNSSGAKASKQSSAIAKSAIEPRGINTSRVQNVLLVWLDDKINEASKDCLNTKAQLRHVVNTVNTFRDSDECIEFIDDNSNEKFCMIISGSLGQRVVRLVHKMSQVDSIFIFCSNQKLHEQWATEWPKIKGVFTEIVPICGALKEAAQQCEHDAVSMSFIAANSGTSKSILEQLDCSFMYTQILKDILLSIQFKRQHINEFIDYCLEEFTGNDRELTHIRDLKRTYREETPIRWYTRPGFLSPMLNRALRTMDVGMIVMMGFFINDLHLHIEKLHAEQFGRNPKSQKLTVYRGQGLFKTDFDQFRKTKGGLMTFNNFLSTSKKRDMGLEFARTAIFNPDMVGILFVMTVDPSLSSTPFASIAHVSYFGNEHEVLFSMHTVFRIISIKPMDEKDRLWQVELILTSDDDNDLRPLIERIREETFPDSEGWYRLGLLLLKMGQSEKAQQVYEVMLQQATHDHEKAAIYSQIGWTKRNQGQYEEAIKFYEQSLEIDQKTLPPTHPDLASSFNNIGTVYDEMGEYSKALFYYEKAFEIRRKTLSPTHLDLAMSYNNIGVAHYNMDEYAKALSSHNKALEIKKKTLVTHPSVAASYNNIGNVYKSMGDFSLARSFYDRAVDTGQRSLPTLHPDLQGYRKNLDSVKKKL